MDRDRPCKLQRVRHTPRTCTPRLYVGCPELRAVRVSGVAMGRRLSRLAGSRLHILCIAVPTRRGQMRDENEMLRALDAPRCRSFRNNRRSTDRCQIQISSSSIQSKCGDACSKIESNAEVAVESCEISWNAEKFRKIR